MTRTIALLTDFGTTDPYVGIMKGVMRSIAPDAHFIDITHQIQPQNITHGAFALLSAYRYFPKGTIFLVVVDPGVGSARKPIVVQTDDYFFVAPDNGVLSYALDAVGSYQAHELTNSQFQLVPVSNTFHGRDIFAPAAAHLAEGINPSQFGERVESVQKLTLTAPIQTNSAITGEVIYTDHFGNIITNIGELRWSADDQLSLAPSTSIPLSKAAVTIRNTTLTGIHRTYSQTQPGDLLALVSSGGFLEVAVNQGSAAARLNAAPHDLVTLTWDN